MASTKIYKNTSDQEVNVIGVGILEPAGQPGDQISVTTEYHQPVVLANYPGVVEVVAAEAAGDIDTTDPTQHGGEYSSNQAVQQLTPSVESAPEAPAPPVTDGGTPNA